MHKWNVLGTLEEMFIVQKWDLLRRLEEIRIVKSMYIWLFLVPIISKLLHKVEEVAIVTIFNYTFELQLTLPFSWKVFYFSALVFAFGNLLVVLFFPSIIKDHKNFGHFKEERKTAIQLDDYCSELGVSLDSIGRELGLFGEAGNADEEQQLLRGFWRIYDLANTNQIFIRIIVSILYYLGFLMIGYILYENLRSVIRYLI